jgi:hypothetical protein
MSEIYFKTGDLCWICIWDESNNGFYKVCGTIIQYTKPGLAEILAGSRIFERKIDDINIFEEKDKFLPWPFNHKEINY